MAVVQLSASEIVLEYVCPALGSITAWLMWLAPLQDVRTAVTKNDLGPLNALPWAVMLGNTLGWVSYGLLQQNWFIFFANAPGFILSIYFNASALKLLHYAAVTTTTTATTTTLEQATGLLSSAVLLPEDEDDVPVDKAATKHEPTDDKAATSTDATVVAPTTAIPAAVDPSPNRTVNLSQQRLQLQERLVLAMVLIWMLVLTAVIAVKSWDDDTRQMITGLTVNANLVFFYGAPLSTIRQVWRSRSSVSLHGPTVARNTLNSVFWMLYGLAVLDPYVAVPNILGTIMGGVQIAVRLVFPRKTKAEDATTLDVPSIPSEGP